MKILKLFISQPMFDKTNAEIKAERQRAFDTVVKMYPNDKIELIDSFFENYPHGLKPLWYLSRSLELLSSADIVYFVKGWDEYRGCKIEHECATTYGYKHIDE